MLNRYYFLIFFISVFVSSVSQILLKKSANKKEQNGLKQYLNILVIFAYFLFFGSTLMTTLAYKGVPLSLGPVIEATGYVYVVIMSRIFLKERITKLKLAGTTLIIIGIMFCNLL